MRRLLQASPILALLLALQASAQTAGPKSAAIDGAGISPITGTLGTGLAPVPTLSPGLGNAPSLTSSLGSAQAVPSL